MKDIVHVFNSLSSVTLQDIIEAKCEKFFIVEDDFCCLNPVARDDAF